MINPRTQENNFDFLRFMAASLVIVGHAIYLTGKGTNFFFILTNGQLDLGGFCVDVFSFIE